VTWLLDVVPPDYRLHGVLRRHPVALAVLARHHLAACVRGAREGYRTARTELGGKLPPGGVEAVLEVYRTEGRRLVETALAVDLVGRALRGEAFTPQLGGTQDERRAAGQRGAGQRGAGRHGAVEHNTRREGNAGERDTKGEDSAGERDTKGEGTAGEHDTKGEGTAGEHDTKGERAKGERGAKGRRSAKPGSR